MAENQEVGIKVHFNGQHVQPDGLFPVPQVLYAFSPSRVILLEFFLSNKKNHSVFYGILTHTFQSTSHTSQSTGFLNTSCGIKVRRSFLAWRAAAPWDMEPFPVVSQCLSLPARAAAAPAPHRPVLQQQRRSVHH